MREQFSRHLGRTSRFFLVSAALAGCAVDAMSGDGGVDGARSADAISGDGARSGDGAMSDGARATDAAGGMDATMRDGAISPPDGAVADAMPGDAGPTLPTPIHYVVVIVKENHTFDNLFYDFPGVANPPPRSVRLSNGTTLDLTRQIAPFTAFPYGDIDHSHARAQHAWHGGAMDRFDQTANGTFMPNHPSFYHYPERQVPNYWQYARHFVLCDNFFASTLAPSTPGHLAIVSAHSLAYANPDCPTGGTCEHVEDCDPTNDATIARYNPTTCTTSVGSECFGTPNVIDNLPGWLSWRAYGSTPLHHFRTIYQSGALHSREHWRPLSDLLPDMQDGDMANLTILDISAGGSITEHPADHPCDGENYTVEIINRIMRGPHWNETAIVVTYDDWGGWYDHVAPHVDACPAPRQNDGFNSGFRLPAIVISPYSRRGSTGGGLVFHTRTEQASIPRLIAELLRDSTQPPKFLEDQDSRARDRRSGSLLGTLDFTQPPRSPLILTPRTDCPASAP